MVGYVSQIFPKGSTRAVWGKGGKGGKHYLLDMQHSAEEVAKLYVLLCDSLIPANILYI